LKGIKVNKVEHTDSKVKIFISTRSSQHTCPCCGELTSRIHDYRNQTIRDLMIQEKQTILILKKRRYLCSCGKKFYENYDFLPKYHRMTNRFYMHICNKMRKSIPMATVAEELGISPTTVTRIFDHIQYPALVQLPEVLSIDEFRGNAETGKYQCILVDAKKSKVLDILPDRTQGELITYFKNIPKKQRNKVKFFVCDMWRQYAEIARTFFPNAKIIVDKYHFIRQVTWAIENVRKRVQKTMLPTLRRYYKKSRTLILRRKSKLSQEQKVALDIMLLYNDDLRVAYNLKEKFFDICHMDKYGEQRCAFAEWIKYAESANINEFKSCITAYRNWYKEILNAFKYGYTNGPTEGFNNKIKVLKRVSYGIKNFKRFRNRILHICA
jgi:transposase